MGLFSRPFGTYSIQNWFPALKRRAIVSGSFGTNFAANEMHWGICRERKPPLQIKKAGLASGLR
jgi:hypothetical protein